MEPPADLLASILRATSGNPCRAAEEQLCDLVDGDLAGVDAELVRGHVATCAPCGTLARALAQLQDTLPEMQEVDPGRAFTAAVVARTSGSRASRLAASLRALWMRPSFALEGAYLGSLVLVGVVAIPGSPLRDLSALPDRAAQAVVATTDEVAQGRRVLDARASTAAQSAEKRAERLAARVREMKRGAERKLDAVIDTIKGTEEETP